MNTQNKEAVGGSVMLGIKKVKRPISGRETGERMYALQYNWAGIATDPNTGETYRCPKFGKYVLREVLGGPFTHEDLVRFAEKYFGNARWYFMD